MANDDSDTQNHDQESGIFDRLKREADPVLGQIDNNAKALLRSALSKLDVVSREEFDAQAAVLKRTRKRVELLEDKINQLSEERTNK